MKFFKWILLSIPYRLATNKDLMQRFYDDLAYFQFLIGWLQTENEKLKSDLLECVSIPYRLATNKKINELKVDEEFCFNSL